MCLSVCMHTHTYICLHRCSHISTHKHAHTHACTTHPHTHKLLKITYFTMVVCCFQESGLSEDIGYMLRGFGSLPSYLIIFFLCLITSLFTQVTTNTGTITIFLPILAEMVRIICITFGTLHMQPAILTHTVCLDAKLQNLRILIPNGLYNLKS